MTKQEALGIYVASEDNIVTINEVPYEDLPLTVKTDYSENRACFKLIHYKGKKMNKTRYVTEEQMIEIVGTMTAGKYTKLEN